MSDTPRTDAFAHQIQEGHCLPSCNSFAHDDNCPVCNGEYLLANFARTLELENNQLRAELAKWKSGCEANAADAADCHRKSDERRLEIIQLRGALRQCAEALQKALISMSQCKQGHLLAEIEVNKALALPAVQNALKEK